MTGHADVIQQNIDVLPRALSLGTQVIAALKLILITTPATRAGSIAGILLREIVRMVKA